MSWVSDTDELSVLLDTVHHQFLLRLVKVLSLVDENHVILEYELAESVSQRNGNHVNIVNVETVLCSETNQITFLL